MKYSLFRKSTKKNEKLFIQKIIPTDDFVQIDDRLKKYPDLSYSNKKKMKNSSFRKSKKISGYLLLFKQKKKKNEIVFIQKVNKKKMKNSLFRKSTKKK